MKKGNGPYQILLAEDNASDVSLVRLALQGSGLQYVLSVARDGAEAISYIETIDSSSKLPALDLLLLDMHMPKHNGEDILQRLRSTERSAQTPVVVFTASDALEGQQTAERHAALYYFRKPSLLADFMRLGTVVRGILAGEMLSDDALEREKATPA
jgi:CheY-like chemotaxis protein